MDYNKFQEHLTVQSHMSQSSDHLNSSICSCHSLEHGQWHRYIILYNMQIFTVHLKTYWLLVY